MHTPYPPPWPRLSPALWLASSLWLGACGAGAESGRPHPAAIDPAAEQRLGLPVQGGTSAAVEPQTQTQTQTESSSGPPHDTGGRAGPARGRLCSTKLSVSSRPGKGSATRATRGPRAAKIGAQLSRGVMVTVDEHEPQPLGATQSVVFDGLNAAAEHTVTIRAVAGAFRRTFDLRFEEGDSRDVCLRYNSFYNSWQLRRHRPGVRCGKCVTRAR